MTSSLPRETRRLRSGAFLLFLALALASCVDGPSPTEFLDEGAPTALLSVAGDFTRSLVEEGGAPVNRIRVTATLVETGQPLGQVVKDVNPDDPTWFVDIQVDVPNIPNPQVVLTVELINVSGDVESVEWSGQTAPIALTATTSAVNADVSVVRGPVENLSVTAVTIIAPEAVRAGKTAALDATVAPSSSGGAAQVYWSSLTPHIGTVSETGIFTALAPGTAQVKATAGAATDTRSIQVLPAIAKVVVEPTLANAHALGTELTFTAWVQDAEGNSIDGETVSWTVDDAAVLEDKGGGNFVAVGEGIATVTATSDSEPTLSGTATAVVKQVPVLVVVDPAEVTLEAVDETAQFSAEAFDENDNRIPWATFAWGSDDEEVVRVDVSGLATAKGGGETEIWAEVLLPVGLFSPAASGAQGVEGGSGVYGRAKVVVDLPLTLSLTPTDASLPSIGATVQMIATVLDGAGNKITGLTYAWASSDPGVATVDANGVVTAVRDGQTTITVSTGGMSATAVVTVKQEVAAVVWTVQPSDVFMGEDIDPPPQTVVVDANGNIVEGFAGQAEVYAEWVPWTTPVQGSPSPTGPERQAAGVTSRVFTSGVIVWSGLSIINGDGYFTLTVTTVSAMKSFHEKSQQFEVFYSGGY